MIIWERRNLPEDAFLVFLDVATLYTNIPKEEKINTVCKTYQTFYGENTPILTQSLRRILTLILHENSFEFNGKNYLQTLGTAMGTKMAVAIANIFMSAVEREIVNLSKTKPLEWKRYIDHIFLIVEKWEEGYRWIHCSCKQASPFNRPIYRYGGHIELIRF